MKHVKQMSESIELGIILAIAGGFMDAYSYICRNHVFANAQTGNMLLLGVNLSEGNIETAITYLFPVLSFAIGIALSYIVKTYTKDEYILHWRQIAVLCEAVVLFFVCFLPQDLNLLANSLTSFGCGIQVQSFRKIHGNGIATTMCIGNLRNGTQNVCDYICTKNKKSLKRGMLYYGIICSFIFGAIIGNFFIRLIHEKAIVICSMILFTAFIMMFIDREKRISTLNK